MARATTMVATATTAATAAAGIMVVAAPRRATARIITFRLRARSSILRAAKLVSRMNGAAALPTSASTALALRRGVGSRRRVSRLAVPMALSTLPPVGVGRFPRHSPVMFCGRAAMWAFARLRVAVPTFMLRSQVKRYASRAGRNSSARFVGSEHIRMYMFQACPCGRAFHFLFRLLKFHVLRLHRNRSVHVNLGRVIKAQYNVLAFE